MTSSVLEASENELLVEILLENFAQFRGNGFRRIVHQRCVHEFELVEVDQAIVIQIELLQALLKKCLRREEAESIQGATNFIDGNLTFYEKVLNEDLPPQIRLCRNNQRCF